MSPVLDSPSGLAGPWADVLIGLLTVVLMGNSKEPEGSKATPVNVEPDTMPAAASAMFNVVIFAQFWS